MVKVSQEQERAQQKAREQAQRLGKLAQRLFNTPDGKEFLDIYRELFAFRRSHVEGDPYSTAFREGQRDSATFLSGLAKGE